MDTVAGYLIFFLVIVCLYAVGYWLDTRHLRKPTHSDLLAHAKGSVGRSVARARFDLRHSKYEVLAELKSLHESGAISDEEFESEKAGILGEGKV